MTGRHDTHRTRVVRLVAQRLSRPSNDVIVAASTKMSEPGVELPSKQARIKWAQAHGKRSVFDGLVRLAQASFHPAADAQSSGQIRVESKRAIDASRTVIEVTTNVAEDVSAVGERNRTSLPSSTALLASRVASAISCARSIIQPLLFRVA
ncbi:hypothetical protein [Rhizobium gallicum]|uniref:hypothetical protein n=1 Tax=Rhizobium gallicum TaxID=56730 RepID=UPI001ABFF587|nr:hypothetical protein [Rhizobium gallicum]